MTCMYTNLDSFNNKRTELEARILAVKPDVIGLAEVNPKNAKWTLELQDLQLMGYTMYCNLEGRGVALYVRDSVKSGDLKLTTSSKSSTWCEVKLKNKDRLVIGLVYRSPNTTDEENNKLIDMVTEVVNMKPSHLMIMGDLNYPGIEWSTMMSTGSMQECEFLESFRDWFLFQHSTQPTHYTAKQRANILDVVMTNEERMVDDLEIGEPVGRSDHVVLRWSLKCYADSIKTHVIKYVYDKGNYNGMRDKLGNVDWKLLLSDKNVDEQCDLFEGEAKRAVEEFVPH